MAFGLKPVRYKDGSPWNGAANLYYVPSSDATAIYLYDAVKSAGSGDAAATGVPTVAQAAAGDTIRGVVVGFCPTTPGHLTTALQPPSTEGPQYRPASTAMYLWVVDDPNVIFEVEEDGDTSSLQVTNIGSNADIVVGTGSTTTGLSGMAIDSSSVVATTAQLRLMRLAYRADGSNEASSDGSAGNTAIWEVIINEHELTGTAGV